MTMEIMSRMLQKNASAAPEEMISISTSLRQAYKFLLYNRQSFIVSNTAMMKFPAINAIPVASLPGFFPYLSTRKISGTRHFEAIDITQKCRFSRKIPHLQGVYANFVKEFSEKNFSEFQFPWIASPENSRFSRFFYSKLPFLNNENFQKLRVYVNRFAPDIVHHSIIAPRFLLTSQVYISLSLSTTPECSEGKFAAATIAQKKKYHRKHRECSTNVSVNMQGCSSWHRNNQRLDNFVLA